jgi:hypothetical protein
MKVDFNIASIWAALVTTGTAMLWLFTNIAWAADIERLEVRMIKADIREIRAELREYPDDDRLREELEELIDELCLIKPDDRECD